MTTRGITLEKVAPCNTEPCGEPQDCVLSDWSEWDGCSAGCNGVTKRHRQILQFPAFGGKACEGDLKQIKGANMILG